MRFGIHPEILAFICNICGAHNPVDDFATEPASCSCGSNVRLRALIHLLSVELFGRSLVLADFPKLKAIRGLGMSDQEFYARLLAEKFDYTNTYYDREPRFDFTEPHPRLEGSYDFILSADVLEHIAPPVERALAETCRLLKPYGFLGITVFCNPSDDMREHFPDLHEYRVVSLGDKTVLVNRRPDGTLEARDDLVFHGGSGATLEMREFGITALDQKLLAAGFREMHPLTGNIPDIGIRFDHDVSQPLIARKDPYIWDACVRTQMLEEYASARAEAWQQRAEAEQERERAIRAEKLLRAVSESRWLRLGRRFGLGPRLP